MSYGILFLRIVLGLILAGHGAQKLFGAFGGHGLRDTRAQFRRLGFRAPGAMALAAGLSEFGAGLLLVAGLLTPLASLAIAVVMLNATATVNFRHGFWNTNGGYEFNLLIWASAVALAAAGGARFSLDNLIGWSDQLSGPSWGITVLVVGVLISALTLKVAWNPGFAGAKPTPWRPTASRRRSAHMRSSPVGRRP